MTAFGLSQQHAINIQPGQSLKVDTLGRRINDDDYDYDENDNNNNVSFYDVYELGDRVNDGKYGTIYKAHHIATKQIFAVKIIELISGDDDDNNNLDSMIQEASILRDLQHEPTIVQLIDFYIDDYYVYIVQNYASGGDVLDHVCEKQGYTEQDACKLLYEILQSVRVLHVEHNIVHRDIKPENILLPTIDDDDYRVQLCDFGHATYLPSKSGDCDSDTSSLLSGRVGTTEYSAPEMIHNDGGSYREEVDMWSIGCTLFVLLCGIHAFEGDTEAETIENILNCDYNFNDPSWNDYSDEVKELIRNLLVVDPKQRWTVTQALQCDWFMTNKHTNSSSGELGDTLQTPAVVGTTLTFKRSKHEKQHVTNGDRVRRIMGLFTCVSNLFPSRMKSFEYDENDYDIVEKSNSSSSRPCRTKELTRGGKNASNHTADISFESSRELKIYNDYSSSKDLKRENLTLASF